jgi:hypothetical protein
MDVFGKKTNFLRKSPLFSRYFMWLSCSTNMLP